VMAIDLSGILESLRQERSSRYQTGLGAMQRAADLFGPGYMKGVERGALASMEQGMVGRGLSNTTRPGALSVGIKQGFEDIRRTRLSDALSNIGPSDGLVCRTLYQISGGMYKARRPLLVTLRI